jgi:hypothetical protein
VNFGVWRSEIPLSDIAAAKQYAVLSEGKNDLNKFDAAVYAFYFQLNCIQRLIWCPRTKRKAHRGLRHPISLVFKYQAYPIQELPRVALASSMST